MVLCSYFVGFIKAISNPARFWDSRIELWIINSKKVEEREDDISMENVVGNKIEREREREKERNGGYVNIKGV